MTHLFNGSKYWVDGAVVTLNGKDVRQRYPTYGTRLYDAWMAEQQNGGTPI